MKQVRLFLFLIILFAFACIANAQSQTQRGVVRTALRPNKKIVYLPGVTIRQRGGHTAVLSGAGGKFEMTMSSAKVGDAFYLSSVRKSGYELADNRTIGRAFTYSSKVPIEIVMINTREKEENVRRISDNSYRRAEKTYSQRIFRLEKQLSDKTISEVSYREQLQELQTWFEKYESLINSMAERYASTDYATIDSLNAAVNVAIENGELELADSLISTVGSLEKMVKENKEAERKANERLILGRNIMENATADLTSIKDDQNRLADLLYSKYSVCLTHAERDSAAYYIQMRAELDTTNVNWQLEAGRFIDDYLADYEKAMALYKRALHAAVKQFGDIHPDIATSYLYIGSIYNSQGNYDQALEYDQKALEIYLSVFGDSYPNVATSYNNIGLVCYNQGSYAQALEYHKKALEIYLSVFGESHPNLATSYNNIGLVYHNQGNYALALKYYNKALEMLLSVFGDKHPNMATGYNNIGLVYFNQGNRAQALEYYNKALGIYLSIFGDNHPNVAASYNNIGEVYCHQGNYAQALEYFNKALEIRLSVFGDKHSDVAMSYNDIGTIYSSQGNYAQALECYKKALEILLLVFGDRHYYIASIYSNIGQTYYSQGNYSEALKSYLKSLKISLSVFGERHQNVAILYSSIGLIYYNQGNYSEAKTYFIKAVEIAKTFLNTDDVNMQTLLSMLYHSLIKTLSSETDEYSLFISDKIFIATVLSDYFTASQQSMNGEYYLLEYSDWNFETTIDLVEKNNELRDKPKDIVLMKDGVITKYHFENTIGLQLGLKFISKEEKQKIIEIYHQWKEKQENDEEYR